jgi:hypothetical protein
MWDAWAVYDDVADPVIVDERVTAADVEEARAIAISYAAYRVLTYRYGEQTGGATSVECFDGFMDVLGLDPADTTVTGDSPVAVGNRIAAAVIARYEDSKLRKVPILFRERVPLARRIDLGNSLAAATEYPIAVWQWSPYDTAEANAQARFAQGASGAVLEISLMVPDGRISARKHCDNEYAAALEAEKVPCGGKLYKA